VDALTLNVLDQVIRVHCADPTVESMLSMAYGAMRGESGGAELEYTVRRDASPERFHVVPPDGEPLEAPDDGALLALFDADVAVALQRRRPDLYFLHAAVLVQDDAAVLMVARSGGGKSTLCWALTHHGFRYASDELGPVDLTRLDVHPYPRTLMVKRDPPASYPMPAGVRTSRGIHVPTHVMPGGLVHGPTAIGAVFFLQHVPDAPGPSVRRLSAAEGAARLYANALNPLAHGGEGMDGAIQIAARPCFELRTAELAATCALVATTLETISCGRRR
jgi:hypothetical protein